MRARMVVWTLALALGGFVSHQGLASMGQGSVIALRTEMRVSANCGFGGSAITYRVVRGLRGSEGIEILKIESVDPETGETTDLEVPELPNSVLAIDRPDVQRVVPTCIDNNVRSYIFYVGSETNLRWPDFGNSGEMQRLFFNIYDDGRVVAHAIPHQ